MSRVLGVLGGKDTPPERVAQWALAADLVVAADSGADACLAAGIRPLVVGDMDSFKGDRHGLEVLEDTDQNTTDCDKLLALVAARGFSDLTIACLEGDRIDHVLASLASLARTSLQVSLVGRRGLGRILKPGSDLTLDVPTGTRLSLLGIGACVATLQGVRWPLQSANLAPPLAQSISNRSEGVVSARVESGTGLLVVEHMAEPWQFPWA